MQRQFSPRRYPVEEGFNDATMKEMSRLVFSDIFQLVITLKNS